MEYQVLVEGFFVSSLEADTNVSTFFSRKQIRKIEDFLLVVTLEKSEFFISLLFASLAWNHTVKQMLWLALNFQPVLVLCTSGLQLRYMKRFWKKICRNIPRGTSDPSWNTLSIALMFLKTKLTKNKTSPNDKFFKPCQHICLIFLVRTLCY